jgi:hypothetical protein
MRAHGFPHARRCLAGDGQQHTDIDGIPGVSIEVKDRASSSWPAWRHQAITQALPGSIVIVVRRVRGFPDVGLWEAQMEHREWLAIGGKPDAMNTFTCHRTNRLWVWVTFHHIATLLAHQDTSR